MPTNPTERPRSRGKGRAANIAQAAGAAAADDAAVSNEKRAAEAPSRASEEVMPNRRFPPPWTSPRPTALTQTGILFFVCPRSHNPNLFRYKNTKNRKTGPNRIDEEITHPGMPRR